LYDAEQRRKVEKQIPQRQAHDQSFEKPRHQVEKLQQFGHE
jgi:predicted Fe-S protein YdhL (DUF1289 family)